MSRSLPCTLLAAVVATAAAAAQAPATVAAPLPAGDGWRAERIHTSDGGVWYAHIDKVVDAYGANEVIAGDDKGRLLVLSVYSGQWTAHSVVGDGLWLCPTRSVDVDPRVPGREIYAGGRAGSVHRITLRPQPFARFQLESVEIGHAAGEEFHAVVAGGFVPGGNDELLAFGISGAVFQLTPAGEGHAFTMRQVASVPGRVRDVVVVPGADGAAPILYGVSRSGDLLAMRLSLDGLQHEVVLHEDCGLGRIAAARGRPGVFYVTRDDGVVVRVARDGEGRIVRDAIFAGGQGLRGVASGRFFVDGREAVAVYGYDRTVHLIHRATGGAWQVATTLTTQQKGHWLAVGELDGRNGTDELVATGFDGDIVLLARPPGYGLPGAAVPAAERGEPVAPTTPGVLRVAARLGERAFAALSPLDYQGGFESKLLVYEPLVRLGADGRIAPALASAWRIDDGGRAITFTLRSGATWHDGSPVRAADVAVHFRRWVGLPQHGWLRSNARIVAVRAIGDGELRLELDRPAAVLADLCAVNPAAVMAPSAWGREGEFVRPSGSGPFEWLGPVDGRRALRYRAHGGTAEIELVAVDGDAVDALLRGEVDAVVSSWLLPVDAARMASLRRDGRFTVVEGPGSSTWLLELRWDRGVLAERSRRAAVAAAIDRAELVRVAAAGSGDVCTGYAAPSIVDWPPGAAVVAPTGVVWSMPLRLAVGEADARLVDTVFGQLRRAGIPVETVAAGKDDDAELKLVRTHGVPYDPFTFVGRFGQPSVEPTAARGGAQPRDEVLVAAVDGWLAATDPSTWAQHYARIQARLDELLPVVPLFAPRRLAIVRAGLPVPRLEHDIYRLDPDWLRGGR